MKKQKAIFVTFRPQDGVFYACISIDDFSQTANPYEKLMQASEVYTAAIAQCKNVVAQIQARRASRLPVPARLVWKLGDMIFDMVSQLARLDIQIDGLYDHLTRDLDTKRKWLEKVVILRRYIPYEDILPENMRWGEIEKGTRRKCEGLLKKHEQQ